MTPVQSREARIWINAGRAEMAALRPAVQRGGGSMASSAREANAIVWATDGTGIGPDLHDGIEWVHVWEAGIDGWLRSGAIDGARTWTASKAAYADPIAEYCLAALLACVRELPAVLRTPRWEPREVRALAGSTVGIVGAGGIGRALIRLLAPFGTRTIALTRRGGPIPGATESVGPDGLDRLLATSDHLVLALPSTAATAGILSEARLRLLPVGATLVNVGRGELIDQAALVEALRDGRIGGAFLDVTDPEPLPADHPLWGFANVAITSHTAATADLGRDALAQHVHDNVRRFCAGQQLAGEIDLVAGY